MKLSRNYRHEHKDIMNIILLFLTKWIVTITRQNSNLRQISKNEQLLLMFYNNYYWWRVLIQIDLNYRKTLPTTTHIRTFRFAELRNIALLPPFYGRWWAHAKTSKVQHADKPRNTKFTRHLESQLIFCYSYEISIYSADSVVNKDTTYNSYLTNTPAS